MGHQDRISALEGLLEADELVGLMLGELEKFESLEDYLRAALSEPLRLLPPSAINATRSQNQNIRPKNRASRKRPSPQTVMSQLRFVRLLWLALNSEVNTVAVRCAGSLDTARAILELVKLFCRGGKASLDMERCIEPFDLGTLSSELRPYLDQARALVSDALIELHVTSSCEQQLGLRFARGRRLLFHSVEHQLAETWEAAQACACLYNEVVDWLLRNQIELAAIDLVELERSAAQESAARAERLVALAHGEVLINYGEEHRALEVLSPHLRGPGAAGCADGATTTSTTQSNEGGMLFRFGPDLPS